MNIEKGKETHYIQYSYNLVMLFFNNYIICFFKLEKLTITEKARK